DEPSNGTSAHGGAAGAGLPESGGCEGGGKRAARSAGRTTAPGDLAGCAGQTAGAAEPFTSGGGDRMLPSDPRPESAPGRRSGQGAFAGRPGGGGRGGGA